MSLDLPRVMNIVEASRDIAPERFPFVASGLPPDLRRLVSEQLSLWPALRRKLPLWAEAEVFVPSRLSLEQCSSAETAGYKARFVRESDVVADLTGGLGVDTIALNAVARRTYYIEEQEALVEAAGYNFPRLSLRPPVVMMGAAEDRLDALLAEEGATLVYVDPARRAGIEGRERDVRRYAIADCRPDLHDIVRRVSQKDGVRLLAKLSTMLDLKHTLQEVALVSELHLVSARHELKELLLYIDPSQPRMLVEDIPIIVSDADEPERPAWSFTLGEEAGCRPRMASQVGSFVYEPFAGVMKSGAFGLLGVRYGIEQLHPNSHLYTSDVWVAGVPARCFAVDRVVPFHRKTLKALTGECPAASVFVRNFPLSAPALRARLGVGESDVRVIIGTTIASGERVLLLATPVRE